MIPNLVALLYLAQPAHGASTNTTSADGCPPLDETSRSVWSILGSCALTLLICVWHSIHFDVPSKKDPMSLWFKGLCSLGSFFAPEVLVAIAVEEYKQAYKQALQFREKGYNWSMTHSFFAGMGGFVYRDSDAEKDDDDLPTIDSLKFLEHCENNKIANPFIRAKHIKALSKSDWLGKALLALQLVWFMLQVVARGSEGLAVTLIEVDTLCMAVISLSVILLWWHKPLRPECRYVFYFTREVKLEDSQRDINVSSSAPSDPLLVPNERKKALSRAWRSEPIFPEWLTVHFACMHEARDEETSVIRSDVKPLSRFEKVLLEDKNDFFGDTIWIGGLSLTWLILGLLHLMAWNFEFPTKAEKISWRVASLVLVGSSLVVFGTGAIALAKDVWHWDLPVWVRDMLGALLSITAAILGLVSRAVLVGLMLASLRALPCSAHQTVSWTIYIPHL